MRVSFLTALHNGLPHTRTMLASLQATLPAGLEYEIIFVNDGSTDGTRAWLASLNDRRLRVIENENNLGFAAANNRGARAAQGEFLALLNNDLEFDPGWLEPMLTLLETNPAIGIVGNLQYRIAGGTLDHAGIIVTPAAKLAHCRDLAPSGKTPKATDVPAVTAACCLIRREVFLRAGGFDEQFFNGGEDVDLCFRLRSEGLRVVIATGSAVRHHVGATRGPTNERDERNSRLLAQRWRTELIRWGSLTHARALVHSSHLLRPWTALPFVLGLTARPPRRIRRVLESAIHREETRWARLFDQPAGSPRAPVVSDGYVAERFFHDEVDAKSAWLRDRAVIRLPAGFPVSNVFLNGFLLPGPANRPEAAKTIGFRIRINGGQVQDFPQLPVGNFNCGVDAPFVLPDRPTRIDVELIDVGWVNFLAWAGRIIAGFHVPQSWKSRLGRYRRQALNRRLRFAQLVCDDEVIFDFSRQPALVPRLRLRAVPGGLNLVGWFRAALGVGESVRCMARACDAVQLPTALIDMKLNCLNRQDDATYATRLQKENPFSVNVIHLDPPQSQDLDHHHGETFRAGKYNIAYWAWELPEFPDEWVRQCAYFDEIWCPSAFVRDAIAAKAPLPVFVMPHAIEFPEPPDDGRTHFQLSADRFLFLFIYDLNSYQERKNPFATIAAYRLAFPDEAGVGLVIKTQNPERNPEAFARLQAALEGLRHVTLITETLSKEDIHRLEKACDAFVSLHRAEGFGLALAECMYLGKPVISTDWSATAEYIDETNGCPVRYHLVRLKETHGPYREGQQWADPDPAHAAEWMRRLVQEPGLAARLGKAAHQTVRERFAPTVIGNLYRKRLTAFALWENR